MKKNYGNYNLEKECSKIIETINNSNEQGFSNEKKN